MRLVLWWNVCPFLHALAYSCSRQIVPWSERGAQSVSFLCLYSEDSSTTSSLYIMDAGHLIVPGERAKVLGAGWCPIHAVCMYK